LNQRWPTRQHIPHRLANIHNVHPYPRETFTWSLAENLCVCKRVAFGVLAGGPTILGLHSLQSRQLLRAATQYGLAIHRYKKDSINKSKGEAWLVSSPMATYCWFTGRGPWQERAFALFFYPFSTYSFCKPMDSLVLISSSTALTLSVTFLSSSSS